MPKPGPKYYGPAGVLLALALIVVLAVVFGGSPGKEPSGSVSDCGSYRNDRLVTINGSTLKAEAPSDQAAFKKGLAGRPCILPDEAMIFPFKNPGQYAFWMKGMKFPIDIIWINSSHQVVADKMNLQPASYPNKYQNPPNSPAQYVLEIKANRSKDLNIGFGTIVKF